ncbi:MAG: polysaccharide pyruvyl transferase family protein, partial [Candidatus Altiarchaeota archaeon]|nr:polysaccharide pyruvyl transferase family protein [Candidatus Altiarchaeota archaeon]
MKKKKKIGILTYHHTPNEGATLQAYALSKNLQKFFSDYTIEIIDYRSLNMEMLHLLEPFLVKKKSVLLPRFSLRKLRRYLRLSRFSKEVLPLSKGKCITENYGSALRFIKGLNYDVLITGSDSVWKVIPSHFKRKFPNVHWLSPDIECKKIAFAASANKTLLTKISRDDKRIMGESVSHMDLIGVRDNHTYEFVESLIGETDKLFRTPDPTFMFKIKKTNAEKILIDAGVNLKKPIVGTVFV